MRKIALVVVAAISVLSTVAPAAARRVGIVTAVDTAAHTFVCHWKTSDWTYRITDKTTYAAEDAKDKTKTNAASSADLKVGATVAVDYHQDGGADIADMVILVGASGVGTPP